MKAEELVALCAAHGIDLVQAAGQTGAPPARDTMRVRNQAGRLYDVLRPPSGLEARGSSSPTYDRPTWSAAELGQAAQGVPPVYFMAACYSFAGDRSVYWKLWQALNFSVAQMAARHNWPAQVRGARGTPSHFYFASLSQLVLDEDANPHIFAAAPTLYAIYMAVDEDVWQGNLFERFDLAKLRYLGWIEQAMRIMQPRLEEHSECES